jgi:hypothetical protein
LVQAWVGFATPAEAWAVTHWTAELLNGPTGWLSKAVLSADALQSAEALAFAAPGRSGALVIALESPASSLEAAIAQTRALLVRLGEQPPKALNFSDAAARRGSLRELRDPRVRLAELAWPRPPAPDSAALGKLLREHFGADKAIVVRSAEPRPAAE